jgi:polar amino acid transport system substrate-binding protein
MTWRHGFHWDTFSLERLRALVMGGVVAIVATMPTSARADILDEILENGVVKIAVPKDLPPFGSPDAQGKLEGYDIDVANILAKELGVRVELVPVTSVDRIPALLTDRAHLVIANLGINPERAKSIAFSSPYAPFFSGVFGAPETVVKGPADLTGKKVAVTRNTIEDQALARLAPTGSEILKFDDNDSTLSAFLEGRVDLVATGNVVIAVLAKKTSGKNIESKFVLQESPASIGVPRHDFGLLHWVNVFVFNKKLTGELDQLSRKWLGSPLPAMPNL